MQLVVTGVNVSDGDPFVWVEGIFPSYEEAREAIATAEADYERDYGESAEEAGVEFEVHEVY